ncbi:MAG: hypothetical protein LQ343_005313 [Gyalolechia ehrenbergii]|nr:MAG: hypothetical protein LQ343_005313 [Gyalolechia ehrenbergii]
MSARLNEYPFLKQPTFFKHHHRRQQIDSPDLTNSDTSVNMDSEKAMITPPTPYYGDDELSGLTDSGSGNIKQDSSDDDKKDVEIKPDVSGPSSDDDEVQEVAVDPVCAGEADGPCTLGSGDHRKVVSHVFGRNKRCTHQIPDDCWIKYCRKHYQRQKYRCPADWFETQLLLIDGQIDKMEAWGGITSWTIAIRKKEREMLDHENSYFAQHGRLPDGPHCRERFLLPYLGSNKTFADIRNLIDIINQECDNTKKLTLPSFELLPVIDERRNPRPKRFGAVRHLARSGTVSNSSTFRLSTDSTGQLLKTEASPGCTPSRATSRVPHRAGLLPKPEKGTRKAVKRSASTFDQDEEKPDVQITRPAKRTHHEKPAEKPIISYAVPTKHQAYVEDEEKQPESKHLFPIRRHKRSLSF